MALASAVLSPPLRAMAEHLDELNKFLLLAKTAKGMACAELIKQVLDSPNIFVFGELLDTPNVQEVGATRSPRPRPCARAVCSR